VEGKKKMGFFLITIEKMVKEEGVQPYPQFFQNLHPEVCYAGGGALHLSLPRKEAQSFRVLKNDNPYGNEYCFSVGESATPLGPLAPVSRHIKFFEYVVPGECGCKRGKKIAESIVGLGMVWEEE
jgi:hypothetical protein